MHCFFVSFNAEYPQKTILISLTKNIPNVICLVEFEHKSNIYINHVKNFF